MSPVPQTTFLVGIFESFGLYYELIMEYGILFVYKEWLQWSLQMSTED